MDQPSTSHAEIESQSTPQWNLTPWFKRAVAILLVMIVFNAVILIRLSFYGSGDGRSQPAGSPIEIDRRMQDCIHNVLDLIDQHRPELWFYRDITNDCVRQVFNADSLVDFDIRREKLLRKELDERVLLWMVVAVTMSGVAFAGMQIWLSYNLALSGLGKFAESSEMSVKKGELALRSSVTGLFILAFSLAFSVSYVKWIYTNQEVTIAHPEPVALPSGTIMGLGSVDSPAVSKPNGPDEKSLGGSASGSPSSRAPEPMVTVPRSGIGQQPDPVPAEPDLKR